MAVNLYQWASIRFAKIASGTEYRIDEQFTNLPIFGIPIIFEIEKNLKIYYFSKL